jgi:GNAT superfamily N-acetyltransferase
VSREAPARAEVTVRALGGDEYQAAIPALAELLVDAVAGNASLNFMAGVTVDEAAAWWWTRAEDARSGWLTQFVAVDGDRIVGSTVLVRARNPNAPHRAEIGKVIVARSHRRRGIAAALMTAAEDRARADGRWLVMLDTVTGSAAARLYESLGWQRAGEIPFFALEPDGNLVGTTYYWKDLR